jgi:hypothetical protein
LKPQTNPAGNRRKRSADTNAPANGKGLGQAFAWLILILLSPALLLLDSLRSGPSHRHTLYAFMLFTTVVMVFTGVSILVTEEPTTRLMDSLNNIGYIEVEEVPHHQELNAIHQAALKYRLDPQLLMAIIKAESSFDSKAVSPKGARGLMQIMPIIWRHYNPNSECTGAHKPTVACHGKECVFSVEANIETGTHYLRDLIEYYNGRVDLALQAYNAGQSNVSHDNPPRFQETKSYLQRIGNFWAEYRRDSTAIKLGIVMGLRRNLNRLFIIAGALWVILFFWVTRRVLPKE